MIWQMQWLIGPLVLLESRICKFVLRARDDRPGAGTNRCQQRNSLPWKLIASFVSRARHRKSLVGRCVQHCIRSEGGTAMANCIVLELWALEVWPRPSTVRRSIRAPRISDRAPARDRSLHWRNGLSVASVPRRCVIERRTRVSGTGQTP